MRAFVRTDTGFAPAPAGRFTRADGHQATLAMLRRQPPEDAEAFGVYFVDTAAPDGQRWTGIVEDVDGRPVPAFVPLDPTGADVNRERERRLEAGAAFPVPGLADPVPLTGRQFDLIVYQALVARAKDLKAAGDTTTTITLRDGADTIHALTADQTIALIVQARAWFEAVMATSWDMKDGTGAFTAGIPADYTDDAHWP